jgi:hypothetical protein
MNIWLNRALLAAAGVAVALTAAAASPAFDQNVLTVPPSRLASYFTLDIPVMLPESSGGPQDMLRNPLEEISASLPLTDELTLESGLNVDVGRVLDRYLTMSGTFDGLFYSSDALNSPYLSLSSGGAWLGLSLKIANGLHFTVGRAASSPGFNPYLLSSRTAYAALSGRVPYDPRNTESLIAGMSWNFTKWGGIGLTASQGTERDGTLGIAALPSARTASVGVSARVGFGGGWVTTATYSEGQTQLNLNPRAFVTDTVLHGSSYGVAVAKNGLFNKHDALGLSFARPAPNFNNTFAGNSANDLQFFGRDKLFSGIAPETDIELGYKTEFFGDSVALQANASYQMNYGGLNGNNAVSLLSRAKIKF